MDAASRKLVAAADAGEIVTLSRKEVKRTQRSLFGLAIDAADVFAGRDGSNRIETLDTVLKQVSREANDHWTLTLDEGGRWYTTETWPGGNDIRPGVAVSIRRASLGGYVMRAAGQRAVRVKRVY